MKKNDRGFLTHIHSPQVSARSLCFLSTFGLGVALLACLALLVPTGVLLLFTYIPDMDGSYASVQEIMWVYPYGRFLRTVHNMAGTLFVVLCLLHFLRVLWAGAYVEKRYVNYLIGLALFITGIAAFLSGYFLPMDQVAYWALTVGLNFLNYLPVAGGILKRLILGGDVIGTMTVVRLYFLHVAILPVLMICLASFHLWRIRKDKGLLKPASTANSGSTMPASPYAYTRELTVFLATLVLVGGLTILFPVTLEPKATPDYPPNPVKAVWLLVATQETLSHSVFWGGLFPAAFCTVFYTLFPKIAGNLDGRPRPAMRWVFFIITVLAVLAYAAFTVVAIRYRGPNWLLLW